MMDFWHSSHPTWPHASPRDPIPPALYCTHRVPWCSAQGCASERTLGVTLGGMEADRCASKKTNNITLSHPHPLPSLYPWDTCCRVVPIIPYCPSFSREDASGDVVKSFSKIPAYPIPGLPPVHAAGGWVGPDPWLSPSSSHPSPGGDVLHLEVTFFTWDKAMVAGVGSSVLQPQMETLCPAQGWSRKGMVVCVFGGTQILATAKGGDVPTPAGSAVLPTTV